MNALARFVLGIGVATENEDGTMKMEDTEFKAKLAVLRNSDTLKHKLKPLHTQMELKIMTPQERARAKKRQQSLHDLWNNHFTVECVNVCKRPEQEREFISSLLEHYG